eukprot:1962044-Pyramimonas_sp.AAC.1
MHAGYTNDSWRRAREGCVRGADRSGAYAGCALDGRDHELDTPRHHRNRRQRAWPSLGEGCALVGAVHQWANFR